MSDTEQKEPKVELRPLTPEEADVLKRAIEHTSMAEVTEQMSVRLEQVVYATKMYEEMRVKLDTAGKVAEKTMQDKTQENIKTLDRQISGIINQAEHVETKYALLGMLYLNYLEATGSADYMKQPVRKEYKH